MWIDAVTVCVNYADYLELTIPYNKGLVDRLVVVTTVEDQETQKLCDSMKVECVFSNRIYENGAKFNRGKAINDGIAHLKPQHWMVIFDSDVIFPQGGLKKSLMLPECFYWAERRHAVKYSEYKHWEKSGILPVNNKVSGPWGYFQCCHAGTHQVATQWYPEGSPTGAVSDAGFASRWKERFRIKLPDPVLHLGITGINVAERITERYR